MLWASVRFSVYKETQPFGVCEDPRLSRGDIQLCLPKLVHKQIISVNKMSRAAAHPSTVSWGFR